jgi:hypothetical protein
MQPPSDRASYRTGVRLSWLQAEFAILAAAAKRPDSRLVSSGRALVRDLVPPPHLDGFSLRDPWPTVVNFVPPPLQNWISTRWIRQRAEAW